MSGYAAAQLEGMGIAAPCGMLTVPAAPVNVLLTGVLRAESWWLRLFDSPVGSSLLCLARKPE